LGAQQQSAAALTATTAGLAIFSAGVFAGWLFLGDTNRAPTYGPTGLPKNCRAIVASNVDGWKAKTYTPEGALNSIDRNCGMFGYSWGQ
jgi:hypothetical protein